MGSLESCGKTTNRQTTVEKDSDGKYSYFPSNADKSGPCGT
jgi:hypothetical protein